MTSEEANINLKTQVEEPSDIAEDKAQQRPFVKFADQDQA
jgi:hypothetical protein